MIPFQTRLAFLGIHSGHFRFCRWKRVASGVAMQAMQSCRFCLAVGAALQAVWHSRRVRVADGTALQNMRHFRPCSIAGGKQGPSMPLGWYILQNFNLDFDYVLLLVFQSIKSNISGTW